MKLTAILLPSLLFSTSISAIPVKKWVLSNHQHWVDLWTAAPSAAANSLSGPYNITSLNATSTSTIPAILVNATVRQTVRVGLETDQIRIRVSNNFGNQALNITGMTVAYPGVSINPNATGTNTGSGSPYIIPDSLKTVTFSGNNFISLPNGALGVSDPIQLPVKAQSQISISIYLANGQGGSNITGHLTSQTDSWFGFGDQTSAQNITGANVKVAQQWYFISAVEGWMEPQASAFAIIGDSITDGVGTTIDGNDRWTDQLLERMQSEGDDVAKNIAVANQAWNGNKVLQDGSGASGVSRVERDVLAQSGVAYAMIFEGVNDIGHTDDTVPAQEALYARLVQAYSQMIMRIHTAGIPVFGATITPFSGPNYNVTLGKYSGQVREQYRQKINTWIREEANYDYVVDFDAVAKNLTAPYQINTTYGIGDYLHFNPTGYSLFAEAFDISVFSRFAGGVSGYQ